MSHAFHNSFFRKDKHTQALVSCKLSICNSLPLYGNTWWLLNNRGLGGTFLTADATLAPWRGNIKANRVYPLWGTELPCSEWLEMSRAGLADQGDNCHKLLPCGLCISAIQETALGKLRSNRAGFKRAQSQGITPNSHTVAIPLHLYIWRRREQEKGSFLTLERHFVFWYFFVGLFVFYICISMYKSI